MTRNQSTVFWWKRTAIVFVILCAVIDVFPRYGAPFFRYTGSDPTHEVWNLGWPVAVAIYDSQSGIHPGPFMYVVLPVQAALALLIVAWFRPISVRLLHTMRDHGAYRKTAVQYWERRRVFYNLALILPALFGYFISAGVSAGVGDRRHLGTGAFLGLFLVSAIGANVCYSFGYALEFFFGSDAPNSRWLRCWRPLLMVLGTLFAMFLALVGGRNIAAIEYSFG